LKKKFIKKLLTLKNDLHWKILILENHWHWKSSFFFFLKKTLKKTTCIEKLLSQIFFAFIEKKLLALKNYFHKRKWFHWQNYMHWKTSFHWKFVCIENLITLKNCLYWKKNFIENLLHIQNVAFKIIFSTWWKLMYENFPFLLKKLWKWLYNMGYLNQDKKYYGK
jgi:hypothetical protein